MRFVWSVDNAFAVFDLLMEWFTFSSLGLKGARRCGLGAGTAMHLF